MTFVARGAHLDGHAEETVCVWTASWAVLHLDPVQVVADAREIAAADAILFAVKMRDTESAARSLLPLVAKGAAVFTFQNGVESAERVGKVVGASNVVPGVARIGAHISEPGVDQADGQVLQPRVCRGRRQAERPHGGAPRGLHDAPAIQAIIPPNIGREVWMKFGMLAPLSGMTALTRGPIGPVRANPQSRALLEAAVKETVAVGVALKTGLTPADAGDLMKLLDSFPTSLMASMAHDLLAGKPIELDGLSGAVARLGKACGVPAPTHTFIAQALAPFVEGRPLDGVR